MNVNPYGSRPSLWGYTLCGQYPGAVPAGATASVYCPYNIPKFRYVIVQFPLKNDQMNICEVEVFAIGASVYNGISTVNVWGELIMLRQMLFNVNKCNLFCS